MKMKYKDISRNSIPTSKKNLKAIMMTVSRTCLF